MRDFTKGESVLINKGVCPDCNGPLYEQNLSQVDIEPTFVVKCENCNFICDSYGVISRDVAQEDSE